MPGADVLATIIGELGVLEDEAKTSSVKVGGTAGLLNEACWRSSPERCFSSDVRLFAQRGIASQREKLKELLSDNFKKRLRKAVTGDETKRVRDHIRLADGPLSEHTTVHVCPFIDTET